MLATHITSDLPGQSWDAFLCTATTRKQLPAGKGSVSDKVRPAKKQGAPKKLKCCRAYGTHRLGTHDRTGCPTHCLKCQKNKGECYCQVWPWRNKQWTSVLSNCPLKSSSIKTCCYCRNLQCYRLALRPIHFVIISANRHVQVPIPLLHIVVYGTATMNRSRLCQLKKKFVHDLI